MKCARGGIHYSETSRLKCTTLQMYLLLYVGVKHGHTYFKEIWCRDVDCTPLVGSYEHRNEHSSFLKRGEFLDHLSDNMSKKDAIPVSCIKS